MRFIKYFRLFLEKFTDGINIGNWTISYNHNSNHDINDRILKRTAIREESEFREVLNEVTKKCESENLYGDCAFISFKYSIKLICVIKDKSIYIITVLGKDEKLKNDKIILI